MAKAQQIYMHKATGNIRFTNKSDGKKLGDEWTKVEFVTNKDGERVMRFKFDNFTIDVQPNGTREVVADNGNGNTK